MRSIYFGLAGASLLVSACVSTSTNPVSSDDTASSLAKLLVGEFDSLAQARADQKLELTEEETHGRVNRVFIKVDAPELGDTVLVGSTRYNGYDDKPWLFDKTEFLVWTFEASDDGESVVMSPRRFKDLDARVPFAQDAEKLAGFGPNDLEPAISGAACDIIWTPTQAGFSGKSKPCLAMSTTLKQELAWRWEYALEDDVLWIEFDGTDKDGNITYTTPVGKPYRLDRTK